MDQPSKVISLSFFLAEVWCNQSFYFIIFIFYFLYHAGKFKHWMMVKSIWAIDIYLRCISFNGPDWFDHYPTKKLLAWCDEKLPICTNARLRSFLIIRWSLLPVCMYTCGGSSTFIAYWPVILNSDFWSNFLREENTIIELKLWIWMHETNDT